MILFFYVSNKYQKLYLQILKKMINKKLFSFTNNMYKFEMHSGNIRIHQNYIQNPYIQNASNDTLNRRKTS